jgi:protein-S-isoprenylcysteine O-methyltransferase Ste14
VTEATRPTWRDAVFAHRGTLLAIPAMVLAVLGKPSVASILVGSAIAFAGEFLRCWAVGYSGVTTRSNKVTAPQLTTAGPYAYVRNPLYLGNFITALGFALAFTGGNDVVFRLTLIVLALGMMIAVYAAIVPREEAYLRTAFGKAFEAYTASVPPIFPRATPWEGRQGTYDPSVILKAETRTFATFGAMLALLALKAILPSAHG